MNTHSDPDSGFGLLLVAAGVGFVAGFLLWWTFLGVIA